ncbi:hypothetical protein [Nocardia donostiensis]|uniref:hypothetical protein n=1 Tax=Nocardia donostiensis TaxID=1538463 RepID=UPI0015893006|nr:hypothetical protein [Nocardia donostiensis]
MAGRLNAARLMLAKALLFARQPEAVVAPPTVAGIPDGVLVQRSAPCAVQGMRPLMRV